MSDRHLRNGFNVGNGSLSEGDYCIVDGRPGTISTVFQDGEAAVAFFDQSHGTFKWRQIMPAAGPYSPPPAAARTVIEEARQPKDSISRRYSSPEKVNHPAHYGGAENPYEAIKIIEAWNLNFCLGNALKYILRAGKKDENQVQDLEKALWYLNRELSQLKKVTPQ